MAMTPNCRNRSTGFSFVRSKFDRAGILLLAGAENRTGAYGKSTREAKMNRRDFLRSGALLGVAGYAGLPAVMKATSQESAASTLWLNWNENPLGLARSAREAVAGAVDQSNRYPDLVRAELATALAQKNGVQPENVVLGCGSTQILQSIVLASAAPNATLVLAEPTFEAILRYQRPLSYRIERVPLDARHAHDLQQMKDRVAQGPAVVYLCNPNNPTATLTPSSEIDAWIEEAPETVLFAIDEAYYEYVDDASYASAIKWVRARPNVVVTRTFSKIYAMAGMRLGYAFADESLARRLRQFLSQDNVNGLAIAAARACLEDEGLLPRSRKVNAQAKNIAHSCLDDLGLEYLPSHANFLMHRVDGDLERYIQRLRDRGIRVGRPFPPMLTYNRLSLGLPDEMRQWAAALHEFRRQGWV
jgi:histidinol-phosphate aminotransferase